MAGLLQAHALTVDMRLDADSQYLQDLYFKAWQQVAS
ncbi:hypothetical protein SAMN05216255_1843 [Pseudomonas segetis]|uniref:Uncharacterized protein n=1 Tax=Pseudomonas segetis TaxID=298908 RepID=A0A239CQ46_9PSED|nr:hypothetical protein SAMN05216255_1843 [Pseudomonas segetis]